MQIIKTTANKAITESWFVINLASFAYKVVLNTSLSVSLTFHPCHCNRNILVAASKRALTCICLVTSMLLQQANVGEDCLRMCDLVEKSLNQIHELKALAWALWSSLNFGKVFSFSESEYLHQ